MPSLMHMSWEQIESSYTTPSDLPDLTSDPTPVSLDDPFHDDDDLEDEKETEKDDDDDEEDVEFKSLDALYQEEFNKQGYKRLMEQLQHDPYQLENNFWQENNYDYKRLKDGKYYDNETVTDYSKSRPKRSSVDYTPSAYTGIRYLEGGRTSRKAFFSRKEEHIRSQMLKEEDEEEKEEDEEEKEEDEEEKEEDEEEKSDDENSEEECQNGDEMIHYGGEDNVIEGGKRSKKKFQRDEGD